MKETLYKAYIEYTNEIGDWEVIYEEYKPIRETKCYWFIEDKYQPKGKRIDKTASNAYAFDTKEKALFNLFKRRERMQVILEFQMMSNERIIEGLKEMTNEHSNQT